MREQIEDLIIDTIENVNNQINKMNNIVLSVYEYFIDLILKRV